MAVVRHGNLPYYLLMANTNTPFIKGSQLIKKGSDLVIPNSWGDCICCMPECSGLCVGKSWALEVIACYYVICGCGVCHDWSFSCGASANINLPNITTPCKRNGEIYYGGGSGGYISVSGTRATRTCYGCGKRTACPISITDYTGGGTEYNSYCSNSYVTASMSSNGPKLVGHNCLASGSIGFSASSSGCTCSSGKPGQSTTLQVSLSGGAKAIINGTTYNSSTTISVGYATYMIV